MIAIEKIEEREGEQYNLSLLEDIKIGYKMTMNAKTISLEPSWFYLYGDEWKPIKVNASRGRTSWIGVRLKTYLLFPSLFLICI